MTQTVIIIGAGAERLVRHVEVREPLLFDSLREFDLWRHGQADGATRGTIEVDVMAGLRELGRPRADLQGEARLFIDELCSREEPPKTIEESIPAATTYRTFLRRWNETVSEGPKEFLERVRLLHARRLIEQQGLTQKQAAYRAGYASSWHMGQALLRRAERNAGVDE